MITKSCGSTSPASVVESKSGNTTHDFVKLPKSERTNREPLDTLPVKVMSTRKALQAWMCMEWIVKGWKRKRARRWSGMLAPVSQWTHCAPSRMSTFPYRRAYIYGFMWGSPSCVYNQIFLTRSHSTCQWDERKGWLSQEKRGVQRVPGRHK